MLFDSCGGEAGLGDRTGGWGCGGGFCVEKGEGFWFWLWLEGWEIEKKWDGLEMGLLVLMLMLSQVGGRMWFWACFGRCCSRIFQSRVVFRPCFLFLSLLAVVRHRRPHLLHLAHQDFPSRSPATSSRLSCAGRTSPGRSAVLAAACSSAALGRD